MDLLQVSNPAFKDWKESLNQKQGLGFPKIGTAPELSSNLLLAWRSAKILTFKSPKREFGLSELFLSH